MLQLLCADSWVCDKFCDETLGWYGGKLIFERIFTEDNPRLLLPFISPSDDDESFVFDEVDAAFRCNEIKYLFISIDICYK